MILGEIRWSKMEAQILIYVTMGVKNFGINMQTSCSSPLGCVTILFSRIFNANLNIYILLMAIMIKAIAITYVQ